MPLKYLAFAARTLRKNTAFTLTTVVIIALGVGASTAIFSVANAVLLRPLPYKNSDRLVVACVDLLKRNVRDFPYSNADYIDLRDGTSSTFQDMAAIATISNIVSREDGSLEQITFASVTTSFFRVTGTPIRFGRDFNDEDGMPQPPAASSGSRQDTPAAPSLPAVAILSYEYFQRRYGGDTSVLGRSMPVVGQPSPKIIGVLPPRFQLYFPPAANIEAAPDVWIANRLSYDAANRSGVTLKGVIGRLKDGVSLERAQAVANVVATEARKNFPVDETAGYSLRLEPMRQHLVAEVKPTIIALIGAVLALLLIACCNVANLLLVRNSLRERELVVRAALGGRRWHLIRLILVEAVLLAGLGGATGVGLAWLGIRSLQNIAPANLPRLDTIRIDGEAILFAMLASLAAAALFGLVPAWRASRTDLMSVLRGSGNPTLFGGRILRDLVIIGEVALSFVLLIGSGLMLRSFIELRRIDPGFDSRGLLTFQVLGNLGSTPEQRSVEVRQIQWQLRSLPGVQSVTASVPFPLTGGFFPIRWGTEEALADASKFRAVDFQFVLPGYFETMHTSLIAGRTFSEADNAPGHNVVVIDQFLAEKAFPSQSAIGKRILIRVRTPQPEWVEIIGVVAHQRNTSLAVPGREQIYFMDAFMGSVVNRWALRVTSDPASYGTEVRTLIKSMDSKLLIAQMLPVDTLVHDAQSQTLFSLLLIGVFAAIAALLTAVGLYGVLSAAVRQRTAEIGLRMALGARPAGIFYLVVGQGLRLSTFGVVIGLIAAFPFTRVIASMLVGVKPTDPSAFVATIIAFFLLAVIASWLPARRAARLDPTMALHEE
jgi:predicted permease